jgi:hypothetical protein
LGLDWSACQTDSARVRMDLGLGLGGALPLGSLLSLPLLLLLLTPLLIFLRLLVVLICKARSDDQRTYIIVSRPAVSILRKHTLVSSARLNSDHWDHTLPLLQLAPISAHSIQRGIARSSSQNLIEQPTRTSPEQFQQETNSAQHVLQCLDARHGCSHLIFLDSHRRR